jgi:hypothetical protein
MHPLKAISTPRDKNVHKKLSRAFFDRELTGSQSNAGIQREMLPRGAIACGALEGCLDFWTSTMLRYGGYQMLKPVNKTVSVDTTSVTKLP